METQKRVYIGGKVSGLNPDAVHRKFNSMQKKLEALGYEVINPVARIINVNIARIELGERPLKEDTHRKEIMGICLYDLSTCDELHLLHDWQDSPGTQQERDFAIRNEIEIVYH